MNPQLKRYLENLDHAEYVFTPQTAATTKGYWAATARKKFEQWPHLQYFLVVDLPRTHITKIIGNIAEVPMQFAQIAAYRPATAGKWGRSVQMWGFAEMNVS